MDAQHFGVQLPFVWDKAIGIAKPSASSCSRSGKHTQVPAITLNLPLLNPLPLVSSICKVLFGSYVGKQGESGRGFL